jgi:hypothetical protein
MNNILTWLFATRNGVSPFLLVFTICTGTVVLSALRDLAHRSYIPSKKQRKVPTLKESAVRVILYGSMLTITFIVAIVIHYLL